MPREPVLIWESDYEIVRRRQEAALRSLGKVMEEDLEMAFKGSKPDKGGNGKGKDLVEQMQKTLDVQSRVIEALARALEAACATEVEADDDEDEDKDENEEEEDK